METPLEATVAQALGRLTDEERKLVTMKMYEQATFRQMATATGYSVGAVHARWQRALAKLEAELANDPIIKGMLRGN